MPAKSRGKLAETATLKMKGLNGDGIEAATWNVEGRRTELPADLTKRGPTTRALPVAGMQKYRKVQGSNVPALLVLVCVHRRGCPSTGRFAERDDQQCGDEQQRHHAEHVVEREGQRLAAHDPCQESIGH